jgi:methyl-accepting chemotaxis protein
MAVQQAADRVQVGSNPVREDRRESHRSDAVFQNRFRLALMKLVFTALVPTVALSLIVSHTILHPDAFLDSPWVLFATAAASLAIAILILQRCDKVSNRYCGPTRRIVQTLEAVQRGERAQPVRVRKNDEFEELAHHLNQALVELGAMDDGER